MVPPKSDEKWKHFVTNIGSLEVTNLPTRMLLNRLKLKVGSDSPDEVRWEAIDSAWKFFSKNLAMVADDIEKLFS